KFQVILICRFIVDPKAPTAARITGGRQVTALHLLAFGSRQPTLAVITPALRSVGDMVLACGPATVTGAGECVSRHVGAAGSCSPGTKVRKNSPPIRRV